MFGSEKFRTLEWAQRHDAAAAKIETAAFGISALAFLALAGEAGAIMVEQLPVTEDIAAGIAVTGGVALASLKAGSMALDYRCGRTKRLMRNYGYDKKPVYVDLDILDPAE